MAAASLAGFWATGHLTTASASPTDTASVSAGAVSGTTTIVDPGGSVLPHRKAGSTGALGVLFGFDDRTLAGGPYENQGNHIYNLPLYRAEKGTTAQFWDNYVEELISSGVTFVAVNTRGFVPGSPVPNGGGDPRALTGLVDAINRGQHSDRLKIAAFDDSPASMTDKKNQIKHKAGGYSPVFDLGDATGAGEGGYQYLWDNSLKVYFQNVPDSLLYKINGRPLVYFWSNNSFAFTNQGGGNSARLLQYVRSQTQSTFGLNPHFVVDNSWLKNDPAVSTVADGANSWFGVPNPTYTNQVFKGTSNGVTVPGFHFVSGASNMVIDPNHGKTLADGLEATVNGGNQITLVEGFTDWRENAALWRTSPGPYSTTQRDYPNQNVNLLRRYSERPFPAELTVQAESADVVHDTTAGNLWNVYRNDDLDVQPTSDSAGGWNVGSVAAGEWQQWTDVPMQGTKTLKLRVATPNSGAQLRLVVDDVSGPLVEVPNTEGWQSWQTINAGTFQFAPGTYHTVRVEQVKGGQNIDWWQAVSVPQPTGAITGYGGKCIDAAGGSSADGTAIQLYTCNGTAAQQWTNGADGTLRLLGKCMDVAAAGTANGTRIQLYTCNGTAAQQWRQGASNSLVNPLSGRCLDATGPSSADGTRLQIWDCASSPNQSWAIPV
ncbi:DUF5010 domain-containing protein [Streptomyces sp. NPDC026673]|uniref:DUF5010 domain-containing protein n=1 Tax=Streptomyces sp. NPDC026673 TaxID=3155724 RepID=UPI0033CED7A1